MLHPTHHHTRQLRPRSCCTALPPTPPARATTSASLITPTTAATKTKIAAKTATPPPARPCISTAIYSGKRSGKKNGKHSGNKLNHTSQPNTSQTQKNCALDTFYHNNKIDIPATSTKNRQHSGNNLNHIAPSEAHTNHSPPHAPYAQQRPGKKSATLPAISATSLATPRHHPNPHHKPTRPSGHTPQPRHRQRSGKKSATVPATKSATTPATLSPRPSPRKWLPASGRTSWRSAAKPPGAVSTARLPPTNRPLSTPGNISGKKSANIPATSPPTRSPHLPRNA